MHIRTTDNTELYLKDWGTGPTVVLVHGWPLNADTWDEVALCLAEAGHRVISYDRRGFGRSSQPWTGYDYDTLSDDLAAVIAYSGAQSLSLVGFSMGGGEVARYLSRHGAQRVEKAVLVSSVLPFRLKTDDNPHGTDASVFERMASALQEDRAKFFTGFFRDFFGVGLLDQPVSDEVLRWAHGLAMQASLRATVECLRAFASTDFRPDLGAFTMPTRLIHGTEDKTVPLVTSSLLSAHALPHAHLLPYEEAPHGLFVSHRQRLIRDLVAFLKADAPAASA
jgi:non-heme chloroperoxidase